MLLGGIPDVQQTVENTADVPTVDKILDAALKRVDILLVVVFLTVLFILRPVLIAWVRNRSARKGSDGSTDA